jgi:chorismate mutase
MKQDLEHGIAEICELRLSIDNLEAVLVNILAERFQRMRTQAVRLRRLAAAARLDPEFAVAVQQFIVHEVVRQHDALRRDQARIHCHASVSATAGSSPPQSPW